MAGFRLEIFKFGLYLTVPIVALLHFGDPKWYHDNVLPYRDKLFPSVNQTNRRIPTDQSGIKEELARIREQKVAKKSDGEQ